MTARRAPAHPGSRTACAPSTPTHITFTGNAFNLGRVNERAGEGPAREGDSVMGVNLMGDSTRNVVISGNARTVTAPSGDAAYASGIGLVMAIGSQTVELSGNTFDGAAGAAGARLAGFSNATEVKAAGDKVSHASQGICMASCKEEFGDVNDVLACSP